MESSVLLGLVGKVTERVLRMQSAATRGLALASFFGVIGLAIGLGAGAVPALFVFVIKGNAQLAWQTVSLFAFFGAFFSIYRGWARVVQVYRWGNAT